MTFIPPNNFFTKLETVHKYYTRRKHRQEYFQPFIGTVAERKALHHNLLTFLEKYSAKLLSIF